MLSKQITLTLRPTQLRDIFDDLNELQSYTFNLKIVDDAVRGSINGKYKLIGVEFDGEDYKIKFSSIGE
jgi:hypothetical protein